jgi:uncharacterized phage protein (TIGR02220 family)
MNRGFKGIWIPREVWLSKELSSQEKVFLAEIESLDNEQGCIASNAYFAKFFDLSKSSVSRIVSKLSKLGYLKVTLIKGADGQVSKRIINVVSYGKLLKDVKEENCTEVRKEIVNPLTEECTAIIEFLNLMSSRGFRTSKSNNKFIVGRLNEGYSTEDLLNVVNVKCSQWLDTDMGKYLRPETLFNATKFPSYLEEWNDSKKKLKVTDEFVDVQTNFYSHDV